MGQYSLDYCQHAGVTASQPSTDITQKYIMNMGRAETLGKEQIEVFKHNRWLLMQDLRE